MFTQACGKWCQIKAWQRSQTGRGTGFAWEETQAIWTPGPFSSLLSLEATLGFPLAYLSSRLITAGTKSSLVETGVSEAECSSFLWQYLVLTGCLCHGQVQCSPLMRWRILGLLSHYVTLSLSVSSLWVETSVKLLESFIRRHFLGHVWEEIITSQRAGSGVFVFVVVV